MHSIIWAKLPAFYALAIFQIGFHIFARARLNWDPPIYTFNIVGMTGVHHAHLYWLQWSLTNFSMGCSQTVILSISASHIIGIIGVSHCT
jgi:hypothetical protein